MGWRNRFHLLMEEAAGHIAKGKQRGMTEFCDHFATYYPGLHEQNSYASKLNFGHGKGISSACSLIKHWMMVISGATQEKGCHAIHSHPPDHIYSALPPLTISEVTVLLFKTSSSTCSLKHNTCHIFEDVGPTNYSFSTPNSSATTFIQAKPLSHLSI